MESKVLEPLSEEGSGKIEQIIEIDGEFPRNSSAYNIKKALEESRQFFEVRSIIENLRKENPDIGLNGWVVLQIKYEHLRRTATIKVKRSSPDLKDVSGAYGHKRLKYSKPGPMRSLVIEIPVPF